MRHVGVRLRWHGSAHARMAAMLHLWGFCNCFRGRRLVDEASLGCARNHQAGMSAKVGNNSFLQCFGFSS